MTVRAAAFGLAGWLLCSLQPASAHGTLAAAPVAPPKFSAPERALLAQHTVLKLGVEGEWAPIEFFDNEGRYSGMFASYIHTLEERLGVRFELVRKQNWDEVLAAFSRGEIDVLPTLSATPENGLDMRFTKPFITFTEGIIVRSDEPFVERITDLPKGKVIAAVSGFGSSERAVQANPGLIVVPVDTPEEGLLAVASNHADVVVTMLVSARYLSQELGLNNLKIAASFDGDQHHMRLALRPAHAALLPLFDRALESITVGEHQIIRDRWVVMPTDRGVDRRMVRFWLTCAGVAMLLLGSWVLLLIRQRRLNQKLLARTEAAESQFRALIDAVPAVFWTMQPAPRRLGHFTVFGSDNVSIAGMPVGAAGKHFEHLSDYMTLEDQKRFSTLIKQHAKTMTPFQFEHALHAAGNVSWLYVHMLPKNSEMGGLIWYGCSMDITERKQLEQALEKSRTQLTEMAASVPGALWQFRREADGRQHYTYISEGIINITGRTPAESNQLMVEKSFAAVHPDDLHIVQCLMHELTNAPGTTGEARYRLATTSGGWKWVQTSAHVMLPEPDGALVFNGVLLDATRQHDTEQALEQARARLEALAASVPGALWQFRCEADGRQHYSYMSEGIVGITGRTPEQTNALAQDKTFGAIHADDRPQVQQLLQQLAEDPGRIGEARYRLSTINGDYKWVQLTARANRETASGATVWNGITLDASRLQEAEAALRHEQARFKKVADSFPGALWQARPAPITGVKFDYMSEGVVMFTGRHAEDVLSGKVIPLEDALPEERPGILAALEHSARTGEIFAIEYSAVHPEGGVVRLLARASVHYDHGEAVWTGVLLNVTAQHQLQQQLEKINARIDEIVNSFPGAIWQMQRAPGDRPRFTYMSDNILTIAGRGPEASLDPQFKHIDVVYEADRAHVTAALEEGAREQSHTRADYRLMTADGTLRWVTASSIAHREPDGTVVWNGVLIDATEQKRLEEQLRAASEQAEAASRAKSQFLANMSHEIRTPMNAVIGLSHIAMTSEPNPVQQARIGKVYNAGKALLKLLNDILEYSRLDAGKFTPLSAAFDLHEITENLKLFNATSAEAKGLTFAIDCAPDTPMHWLGDATRIQQILLNLIANAIKFTDRGQVTLSMTALPSATGLCFKVQDSGIGMSAEQLNRVFDVFEQANGEIERRHGGSGLGLSISRGLVEALGGSIEAQSEVGSGTVFSVRLPLQRVEPPTNTRLPVEFQARLAKLAMHIRERDVMAARTSLQNLRLLLNPMGRDHDLNALERQLSDFELEGAAAEVAQLQVRWGASEA